MSTYPQILSIVFGYLGRDIGTLVQVTRRHYDANVLKIRDFRARLESIFYEPFFVESMKSGD